MADTTQIVCWSLAYTCPIRPPETLENPEAAVVSTQRANQVARFLDLPKGSSFGIFGDVCVTGYTLAGDTKNFDLKSKSYLYPTSGFSMAEELASVGGLDGLLSMCKKCPANTTPDKPAGCTGVIYMDPDAEKIESRMQTIISRTSDRREFAQVFTLTKPLWYGLWNKVSSIKFDGCSAQAHLRSLHR